MKFTIPGAPIALQRARTGRHGFYDPQKHIKTAMAIHLQNYQGPLLSGPQLLIAYYYMPIPKTASKKTIEQLHGTFHPYRPDLDNLIKWIGDFCQSSGNIFKDDCCIAADISFKIWEHNKDARTEFEFVPLNNHKLHQPPTQLITQLFMKPDSQF